jgi:D-lactate dehydrogenase (cytochrome)
MSNLTQILSQLKAFIPPNRLSTTHADRAQHSQDQSDHPPSLPDVVIWVTTTAEVSAILKLANEHHIPVTPWGAGTSLEGNPIPLHGGILLDMTRMNSILTIHEADFQVTVQTGIFYKDMNKVLGKHGLFFPPDPGANASVGGMLANNAAGIRTVKYGATKDNVLALEVVLANGDIIRTGSRAIKQSSGYDLTHLFVGSEGTLGIITEATLKLHPIPAHYATATVTFPSVSHAAQAVFEIRGAGLEPSALELLDAMAVAVINHDPNLNLPVAPTIFMEFGGASEAALAETIAMAQAICTDNGAMAWQAGLGQEARAKLWEARHRLFEISVRAFPGQAYIVTDVAVPISALSRLVRQATELMETLGLPHSMVGHAGDGNIHHIIFFPPDDDHARASAKHATSELVKMALQLGGTATGEHGVGIGKQAYMALEHGESLNVMRSIKALFDPHNVLNPSKVLN